MRIFGRRPRRVLVHFGFPKTGTTSLQNVFHAERERLLKGERVLYPALDANLTNSLCTMFLDDPLTHITNKVRGLSHDEAVQLGEDYRAQLEQEINGTQWDTLLLSAEGLSNLAAPNLARLREWLSQWSDDISVVACVRDPLGYTASVVQQIMKGGETLGDLYGNLPLPNYRGKLGNAISAFGRENVRTYCFEDAARSEGGVVAAFAREVGLPERRALDLAARAVRDNESLSEVGVLVLDGLNKARPMFKDGVRNPQRSGRELAWISRLKGGRFTLPPEVAARVREQTRDDVAWLNETFGTTLYTGDAPDAVAKEPAISEETALSMAVVIADLVNHPKMSR